MELECLTGIFQWKVLEAAFVSHIVIPLGACWINVVTSSCD